MTFLSEETDMIDITDEDLPTTEKLLELCDHVLPSEVLAEVLAMELDSSSTLAMLWFECEGIGVKPEEVFAELLDR